jgi:hypothetical protein
MECRRARTRAPWWRDTNAASRRARQARRPGFDVMEGRVLLSTGSGHLVGAHLAALEQARALRAQAAVALYATSAHPAATAGNASFGNQVSFALKTYADGKSIPATPAVRNVAIGFAKAALSADARRVGLDYLKAVIHGNGKTINDLGHTALVKKVGGDFSSLGHAKLVKYVGNALSSFGRSVASQFDRLFLHKSNKPAPTKTK